MSGKFHKNMISYKEKIKCLLSRLAGFPLAIKAEIMAFRMAKKMRRADDYRSYLKDQISTSLRKNSNSGLNNRTVYLAEKLNRFLPESRPGKIILCVGCRNRFELDEIERVCACKASGLDLFSVDPRIHAGDMHAMPFEDSSFDAVYSCHSLEHSHDYAVVLKEFVRVVKPGGLLVIEIPVVFTPSASDRWDAGSVDNLLRILQDFVQQVLFKEETERAAQGILKKDARLIIRIKK